MPKPTLSQAQIDALNADKTRQQSASSVFSAQAAAKDAEIAELQILDSSFLDLFNWYNDSIIGQYDAERKAIEGVFVANPIVEQDILDAANLDGSGRLTPTLPDTDLVRVAEFDGGGTTTTTVHENTYLAEQTSLDWTFRNGYPLGGYTDGGPQLTWVLEPDSTTIQIEDTTNPLNIQVGDILVVDGDATSGSAVCRVLSEISSTATTFEGNIEFIIAPNSQIAFGSFLVEFTGFTDAERSTKTASDSAYQNIMDALVTQLETAINNRLARLAEQLTALNANEDPDGTADIAAAITDVQDAQNFLNNYLLTTDVSDAGLLSMVNEISNRNMEITARLAQITAAYTGQTENYYNQRYNMANNRGNTQRGTLRRQKHAETTKTTSQGLKDAADAAVAAYDDILS